MACDIQVVNPSVLSRIESFMNDSSYKEAIENSANYNTRLCIERRLRMPFLDSQTGVAQNHSNLFMNPRERIPGLQHGQLYTYPSKRWRKKRRQYLMQPQVALRRLDVAPGETVDLHTISTLENPAAAPSEDSKDSAGLRDDSSAKASQDAWYYDELELQGMEGFDEPDPDSDYDYEETYSKRRKKRGPGVKPSKSPADSPHPKKGTKGTGVGRGRKKGMNYTEIADSEKPFSCDLCGARYKTRPGLTYHYTHSHKEGTVCTATSGRGGGGGSGSGTSQPAQLPPQLPPQPPPTDEEHGPPPTTLSPPPPHHPHSVAPTGWTKFQDSYLTYLNAPGGGNRRGRSGGPQGAAMPPSLPTTGLAPHEDQTLPPPPHHHPPPMGSSAGGVPSAPMPTSMHHPHHQQDSKKLPPIPEPVLIMEQNEKERAAPSTYCDFCLGDAVANKKSGQPEELVSCSDCGRSGHPSCLQFTDNMTVSVRKYRWQCIECKCCSICGTSDNDDQLLFCDDCDRGYHMYCLVPPLHEPPEGSWSCRLCLIEFHNK